MKVLLTVPIQSMSKATELMDIGLGYLTSVCQQAGAEVHLVDWNARYTVDSFTNMVKEFSPDLVGVKVFTVNFLAAQATLRAARRGNPKAIILIGGPHPSTSKPKDLWFEFGGLMDLAIAGEGERAIQAILDLMKEGSTLKDPTELKRIPGLIYPVQKGIAANPRDFREDLDSLPCRDLELQQPQYYYFGVPNDPPSFSKTAVVETGRGCPARCGYCMGWLINGGTPRYRSLDAIKQEIYQLVNNFATRRLMFTDNVFFGKPDRVKDLCQWIIEKNLPIKWDCIPASYVSNVLDKELLQLMSRAGCDAVMFGIESGSESVLQRLRKSVNLSTYSQAVHSVAAAGINPIGFFMFGFPEETLEEMDETLSYAESLPFRQVMFTTCLPLPRTTSYKGVLSKYQLDRIDWQSFDMHRPSLLPCDASPGDVRKMLIKANWRNLSGVNKIAYLARSIILGKP